MFQGGEIAYERLEGRKQGWKTENKGVLVKGVAAGRSGDLGRLTSAQRHPNDSQPLSEMWQNLCGQGGKPWWLRSSERPCT